jgi:hypothetical protein
MCLETPELKLGPGTVNNWPDEPATMGVGGAIVPGREGHRAGVGVLAFARGFCTFDENEKDKAGNLKYEGWEEWIRAPGTPHIEILNADDGVGLSGEGFICPIDGLPFKAAIGLNSHMRKHAREAVTA